MASVTRALIFDFDGTIADTETPLFRAWGELYARHEVELDLAMWQATIGSDVDPDHWAVLELKVGSLDRALDDVRRARRDQLIHEAGVRPGVVEWLDEADAMGIPVGIASSSPIDWVTQHLDRLELGHRFACLSCCNEITPAKPDPTSYREACRALRADPARSIAVEDSPHGIAAAKDAGLFVVATPHGLTSSLDLSRADLVVESLAELTLRDVVARARS